MRRLLLSLGFALIAGCTTVNTTAPGVVGVQRSQTMTPLVSPADVNKMAAQQYAQTLKGAQQKGALNADAAETQRVRAIAQRLIPETRVFRPDAVAWRWEINVITSDELNAWCMPGGKIAVYTGLIDKLSLTDDELAAVMGHEIAHALREHSRENMSRQMPAQILLQVVGAAYGGGVQQMGGQAYQLLVGLPNSREMETEADRIGTELMARAGYNPEAAVNVWHKMQRASQGKEQPELLSTHPSSESRIADLSVVAKRVEPLYQQARR
ncbi:M48 family metallopeptidase [Derxia lacustris]|uniref:M48 family metallopeptidase n=1 Tax=Derxia lacustris TaxID=764842 RepID=UPI001F27E1FA|nr:M48 family metallopeptidase [Derxia lacustris]